MFAERMIAGKQRALDARNNGGGKAHSSWDRAAKAKREAEQNDPDVELAYRRQEHMRQLASLEIFHNPAQAIEEFCRKPVADRDIRSTDVPFEF